MFQIKVQVCVQFFKVGEIDTLKEQYTADVIVRARWREPSLDGQLSEVNTTPALGFVVAYLCVVVVGFLSRA